MIWGGLKIMLDVLSVLDVCVGIGGDGGGVSGDNMCSGNGSAQWSSLSLLGLVVLSWWFELAAVAVVAAVQSLADVFWVIVAQTEWIILLLVRSSLLSELVSLKNWCLTVSHVGLQKVHFVCFLTGRRGLKKSSLFACEFDFASSFL